MSRVAHVIGNGPGAAAFYKPSKGLKITCNIPPMAVDNVYTTCIVDFKMCHAIDKDGVVVPGDWVCGARPKKYTELHPNFYLRHSHQIKEFYLTLPKYVKNYTDFNCGHMATHYTANKLNADEIHMYGFDSMFDFDLSSSSDLFLNSDRGRMNNARLTNNWRPIWQGMFKEFSDRQFVLYHKHNAIKFDVPENVEIRTKS